MRQIAEGIDWVGAIDWDRRDFDGLVPLPAGTTYNAWLIRGRDAKALVDSVDPAFTGTLMGALDRAGAGEIDYLISNHAEQDHSGSLPALLERFPRARLLATPEALPMLEGLLHVPPERLRPVADGERLPLGGRTLRFLHFPWAHWPETMVTFLEEERVLFPCDLFGAHLAAPPVGADLDPRLREEALRYYACIMMPYRRVLSRNLPRLEALSPRWLAPSHGPAHPEPAHVLHDYRTWMGDRPSNRAVIAWTSMHGSTHHLAQALGAGLAARGVEVHLFNLQDPDLGKLASLCVDAATLVFASPAVLGGLHPKAAAAAFLMNGLQPKARWVGLLGSYGWAEALAAQLGRLLRLEAELLEPVIVKGAPRAPDLAAVDRLAEAIARRHHEHGLLDRAAPSVTLAAAPPTYADPSPPPEAAAAAPAPAKPAYDDPEDDPETRWLCRKCAWIYNPKEGDPEHGIPAGTAFNDIPDDWRCPLCGLGKDAFEPL